jgi:hypothetical protein
LGHDEEGGAEIVGAGGLSGRHDEVSGRAVGGTGVPAGLFLAVFALIDLGGQLGVGQKKFLGLHQNPPITN